MNWQQILANGFSNSKDLLQFLEITSTDLSNVESLFSVKVPLSFALKMQKKNPRDPLLLQVLADRKELTIDPAYTKDPLLEAKSSPVPGLIHKYPHRVLLILTGACAIHCRYCFRRHFPYHENNLKKNWKNLDYIKTNTSIKEIILSGGDPLLFSDSKLLQLIEELNKIPHLKTLRIHTRVPIVLPERITADFISVITQCHLKKIIVMHCNHPQELDEETKKAFNVLRSVNIFLLNQTVLLKKINDDVNTLALLNEKLFEYGVLPYYLHLLDKVSGSKHFGVSKRCAQQIFRELCNKLPGYLVPRLVYEKPGALSKTLII